MDLVSGFGYLSMGVADLDAAVRFYRQAIRLEPVEEHRDVVYLSGDANHHWLRLERSDDPGLQRVGYRAVSGEALDLARARLADAGITVRERAGSHGDQLSGGFMFRDPACLEVDLYEDMQQLPFPAADPDVGFICNLHAVIGVPDVVASASFYRQVLGFRRSDQMLDIVAFLRSGNRYHHSLAFARADSLALDHFCILVAGLDELMRLRGHLQREGVLGDDLVRHAASGSISVYAHDPLSGAGIEFCTGHAVITDDSYTGRMLRPGPSTVNMWARPFRQREPTSPASAPTPSRAGAGSGSRAAALAQRD